VDVEGHEAVEHPGPVGPLGLVLEAVADQVAPSPAQLPPLPDGERQRPDLGLGRGDRLGPVAVAVGQGAPGPGDRRVGERAPAGGADEELGRGPAPAAPLGDRPLEGRLVVAGRGPLGAPEPLVGQAVTSARAPSR